MTTVHIWLGYIILAVTVGLAIWNIVRITQGVPGESGRRLLVGLLDLQVLLGIVALILTGIRGWFWLHPILMLAAVATAHTLLKSSRPKSTQITGYALVAVAVLVGAIF
ncbi:MAG: hypothetical protein K6T83_04350 [Alicyclobacillus sp.]|nr:hypothetical protein [Alicyclobacillus sp.]